MRALAGLLTLIVTTAAACNFSSDHASRFSERGIQLQIPSAWSITGFSTTNAPTRLVAASYDVDPGDVEGDCGGHMAVDRLPEDGAFIALIDYGDAGVNRREFKDILPLASVDTILDPRRLGQFDCFGSSYLLRTIVAGRPLQIHVGFGRSASAQRRDEVLGIVNSITVLS